MKEQAYSGAFSRRYSGFTSATKTATTDPKPVKKLNVSWNGGMGKVNGTGNYTIDTAKTPANSGSASANAGDSITLTATADKGFHFGKWLGYPVEGNTSNTVTVKMTNDFNVAAVFEADKAEPEAPVEVETETITGTVATGIVDKVKPFVKKWWWAILIVAYIAYKEWKGAKQ